MLARLAAVAVIAAYVAAGPADAFAQIVVGETEGPASPYPSTIQYPADGRVIEDVDVRLENVAHEFPDELDIAVTGPGDRTVMLMSDALGDGGCSALTDLTFSMQATGPVPDFASPCSGTYLPTDNDPEPGDPDPDTDLFAAPAPVEPFATTLDVFNGTFTGGKWDLRVMDDTSEDGGSITGWSVRFDTRVPGRVRLPGSGITIPETDPLVALLLTRSGGSATAPLGAGTISWQGRPCGSGFYPSAAEDFTATTGTVAFAPKETQRLAVLSVIDDHVPEPIECLRVVLTGGSGDAAIPTVIEESVEVKLRSDDLAAEPPRIAPTGRQRVLRAKAVKVTASSFSYGELSATGRISLPRAAAAVVRLKPARPVSVTPGQRVTLKLALRRKALRAVRRAFERRRRLVATLTLTATDLAGGSARRVVRVKLRR